MPAVFVAASMSVAVLSYPVATQKGPCGGWSIVSVPRGGPRITSDVSTTTLPSVISSLNRSMPRGRRPELVLAGAVVLRAVARALEPLRGPAERHPAAQVHAPLVQGHDALGRHALRHVVDVTARRTVVPHHVEPARAVVGDARRAVDLGLDVGDVAGVDERAEPALEVRPQERDRGAAELGAEHDQRREQGTAEEVAPRERLDRLAGNLDLTVGGLAGRAVGAHERQAEHDREDVEHHEREDRGDERRRDGHERAHSSKNTPCAHGQTQLYPGPRKNEPMIVRTPPNMNRIVNSVIAILRSPGLLLGLRST